MSIPSRVRLAAYLSAVLLLGLGFALGFKSHRASNTKRHGSAPSAALAPQRGQCRLNNRSAAYVELSVRGQLRRFFLVPPKGVGTADLIIGFHGRGRSGEYSANYWALGENSQRAFVALYPDGLPQPWFRHLVGWDTRSEASTDLALYDALVE